MYNVYQNTKEKGRGGPKKNAQHVIIFFYPFIRLHTLKVITPPSVCQGGVQSNSVTPDININTKSNFRRETEEKECNKKHQNETVPKLLSICTEATKIKVNNKQLEFSQSLD